MTELGVSYQDDKKAADTMGIETSRALHKNLIRRTLIDWMTQLANWRDWIPNPIRITTNKIKAVPIVKSKDFAQT